MSSSSPSPNPIISRAPPQAVTYDLAAPNRVRITLPRGSKWSSGLHWHERHTEYLLLVRGSIRVRLGGEVRLLSASKRKNSGGGQKEDDEEEEGVEVRVPRGVWHEWCRADASFEGEIVPDAGAGTRHSSSREDGGGRAPGGEGQLAEEEADGDDEEEEVVVIERTDPEDGEKAVFFYNLNGVILQAQQGKAPVPGWAVGWWVSLRLWLIFGVLDNYPVFWGVGDAVNGWMGRCTSAEGEGRGEVRREGIGHGVIGRVERWLDWVVTRAVLGLAGWVGWVLGMEAVRREFMPREEWERWVARKGGKEKGV